MVWSFLGLCKLMRSQLHLSSFLCACRRGLWVVNALTAVSWFFFFFFKTEVLRQKYTPLLCRGNRCTQFVSPQDLHHEPWPELSVPTGVPCRWRWRFAALNRPSTQSRTLLVLPAGPGEDSEPWEESGLHGSQPRSGPGRAVSFPACVCSPGVRSLPD